MKAAKILSVVMGLCLLGTFAHAYGMMNVDDHIAKMKKELNLTDDQAKAVKPILEDYKKTMDQAAKDKEDKLGQVLSPDQMKMMKDMHAKREKMEEAEEKNEK